MHQVLQLFLAHFLILWTILLFGTVIIRACEDMCNQLLVGLAHGMSFVEFTASLFVGGTDCRLSLQYFLGMGLAKFNILSLMLQVRVRIGRWMKKWMSSSVSFLLPSYPPRPPVCPLQQWQMERGKWAGLLASGGGAPPYFISCPVHGYSKWSMAKTGNT